MAKLPKPYRWTEIELTRFWRPSLENRMRTKEPGQRLSRRGTGMSGKLNVVVPTVKLWPDGLTRVTLPSSDPSPETGGAAGATEAVPDMAVPGQARARTRAPTRIRDGPLRHWLDLDMC